MDVRELDELIVTPASIEDITDDALGFIPGVLKDLTELGVPDDGGKLEGETGPVETVLDTCVDPVPVTGITGMIKPEVELDPLLVTALGADPDNVAGEVLDVRDTPGSFVDVTPNRLDIKLESPPVGLPVVLPCAAVEPETPEVTEIGITTLPLPLGLLD